MYSVVAKTNSAWLQSKGVADIGLPEWGSSCSGNAPVDKAFFAAHLRKSIAPTNSSIEAALAMCHLANLSVEITHGFPAYQTKLVDNGHFDTLPSHRCQF